MLIISTIPHDHDGTHGGKNRFECRTCPYQMILDRKYYERKNMDLKGAEDVLGGADSWKNVDQAESTSFLFLHLLFLLTHSIRHVFFLWVFQASLSSSSLNFQPLLRGKPRGRRWMVFFLYPQPHVTRKPHIDLHAREKEKEKEIQKKKKRKRKGATRN
ncbi:hypothetical protein D0861_08362 [Hortaea werneckii]|uniref:DNA-directed RNA polymerase M/15kDa subunit domain-containing protein n=1 Tax=Hortaea werneckii TaxID=91943 RepID=A0A3M7EYE6_HORWE|nr:hypothetical protein D0861_08362 [Hortaea werneckii]